MRVELFYLLRSTGLFRRLFLRLPFEHTAKIFTVVILMNMILLILKIINKFKHFKQKLSNTILVS